MATKCVAVFRALICALHFGSTSVLAAHDNVAKGFVTYGYVTKIIYVAISQLKNYRTDSQNLNSISLG